MGKNRERDPIICTTAASIVPNKFSGALAASASRISPIVYKTPSFLLKFPIWYKTSEYVETHHNLDIYIYNMCFRYICWNFRRKKPHQPPGLLSFPPILSHGLELVERCLCTITAVPQSSICKQLRAKASKPSTPKPKEMPKFTWPHSDEKNERTKAYDNVAVLCILVQCGCVYVCVDILM